MNIARSLTAIALISLSGLAAAAQSPVATPQVRAEVRHDNRNITHDKQALVHSRTELHQAQRAHDYRRVKAIRHEMHHQHVALHHDHATRRHDVRDTHHS
jgi:hypothetical protein